MDLLGLGLGLQSSTINLPQLLLQYSSQCKSETALGRYSNREVHATKYSHSTQGNSVTPLYCSTVVVCFTTYDIMEITISSLHHSAAMQRLQAAVSP